MTTLLIAMAALLLPTFPIGSAALLGAVYVKERVAGDNRLSQVPDLILFYGALVGIGVAYAGW